MTAEASSNTTAGSKEDSAEEMSRWERMDHIIEELQRAQFRSEKDTEEIAKLEHSLAEGRAARISVKELEAREVALAHASVIAAAFKSGELVDSATVKEAIKTVLVGADDAEKYALALRRVFSRLSFSHEEVKMVQRELNLEGSAKVRREHRVWRISSRRATRQT